MNDLALEGLPKERRTSKTDERQEEERSEVGDRRPFFQKSIWDENTARFLWHRKARAQR